ncbi:MAG: Ig domain-containing protein, partial [Kiritimatiellae bacterium]|nr:Ig domain-containing protein [Kiritimatiellia bacterium]
MKTKHLLLSALAAVPAALLCTSCVEDDWDDGYYGSRRPRYYDRYDRYDDYDDGYRAGYEDRRRDERHHDRDRDRRDRDARPRIPKGFVRAGSYNAGGAVEAPIPTRNPIKQILVASTSGSVSVNTVVLREGNAKTPYPLSVRLEAGQTQKLTPVPTPAYASDARVEWTSSNPSVVSFEMKAPQFCYLKALKAGTATITA